MAAPFSLAHVVRQLLMRELETDHFPGLVEHRAQELGGGDVSGGLYRSSTRDHAVR